MNKQRGYFLISFGVFWILVSIAANVIFYKSGHMSSSICFSIFYFSSALLLYMGFEDIYGIKKIAISKKNKKNKKSEKRIIDAKVVGYEEIKEENLEKDPLDLDDQPLINLIVRYFDEDDEIKEQSIVIDKYKRSAKIVFPINTTVRVLVTEGGYVLEGKTDNSIPNEKLLMEYKKEESPDTIQDAVASKESEAIKESEDLSPGIPSAFRNIHCPHCGSSLLVAMTKGTRLCEYCHRNIYYDGNDTRIINDSNKTVEADRYSSETFTENTTV